MDILIESRILDLYNKSCIMVDYQLRTILREVLDETPFIYSTV